jgi:N6-adenosine-specific RNA methylase IME4
MKFKTILIDPPWPERGGGKIKRGADRHYNLMTLREIKTLPIPKIADDNCHIYMWATNNYLEHAFTILRGWGFRYITNIAWVKSERTEIKGKQYFKLQNPGLGQYVRGIHEICLFGTKGRLPYKIENGKRQQAISVITAPRTEHSKKPIEIYNMIEKVSYPPYVEIFARNTRDGWTSIGNEIDGKDVFDWIGKATG